MRRLLASGGTLALLAACASPETPLTAPDDAARLAAAPAASAAQDGDYIVVFRPGTANPNALADDLARAVGGTVRHRYSAALQGFAARLPAAALNGIRNNPNVELVEPDGVAYAIGTQTLLANNVQWGLDRVDVRTRAFDGTYAFENDGAGVEVYILDTGIRYSHQEFGGRARSFYDYVYNDADANDVQGHGTHVAGTVGGATVGVAKGVTLWGVKVLGDNGSGSYSGIIAGVDAVTAVKKADPSRRVVGNMSLGGGVSSALNTAVNNSVAAGVVWVVAAGNANADACNYSPASAASALTVGATTSSDARSSFSNFGSCVDLFAPGSSIYSSTVTGNNTYASWNGTSMASPHVAGAAALYLAANPTATAAAVNGWITGNATTDVVTGAGTGSPNRLLHTLGTGSAPPPPPPTTPVMAISALTGTKSLNRNNWSATATAEVRTTAGAVVSGAVVSFSWSGAARGTVSCTTGANGQCSRSVGGLRNTATSITFTVTGVSASGFTYDASRNAASSVTVTR
jgi:subtilisin family serine protease